jgi:hypothetical protein
MAKKFMYLCFGILALVAGSIRRQAAVGYSDVAVSKGVIQRGDQIPLPYCSDGTQALQEECVWIVAPQHLHTGHNSTLGFDCATYSDRTLLLKQYTTQGQYYDSHATCLIIGVRGGGASSTDPAILGQIKAAFGE